MPNSVIENMKDNSTLQVDDFNRSDVVIGEQLAAVNEQITTLIGVLNLRAGEMIARLEIKKEELGGEDIVYGPLFNVHGPAPTSGNIIDWHIDSTAGIIYEFEGIGWDSDSVIIDLNTKWNWTSVYLYQPAGLDGTYGLVSKRDQLNTAIGVNAANRTQIEQTTAMLP